MFIIFSGTTGGNEGEDEILPVNKHALREVQTNHPQEPAGVPRNGERTQTGTIRVSKDVCSDGYSCSVGKILWKTFW